MDSPQIRYYSGSPGTSFRVSVANRGISTCNGKRDSDKRFLDSLRSLGMTGLSSNADSVNSEIRLQRHGSLTTWLRSITENKADLWWSGRADNGASFHLGRNLALQFAPAGPQSGGFQNVSERWIVIQREQKCKAI